jgi:hypothetical protein
MRECWINVYDIGLGCEHSTREEAIRNAINYGLLYRIHVRLK